MKNYFDVLKKCKLFHNIADEDLTNVLECLGQKVISYQKGETVFDEGDRVDEFGLVLSGSLKIMRVDYYGNRSIISAVNPGDLFAESFACVGIDGLPVTVVADSNSEIMFIEVKKIIHPCEKVCDFHSKIIYNLLKIVALKNIKCNEKIEITSKRTTRDKLMAYLLFEARRENSKKVQIPFNRQELADYLEVDRSGLSAEISKLRKEGIINCSKNRFEFIE